MRQALLLGIAFGLWCTSATSWAQHDRKQICAAAYEEGQRLQRRGALLEARKQLLVCGGLDCPQIMHSDCERWLSQVEASLSTVVFRVVTEAGSDVVAQVSVDGAAPRPLQGRALELDPGEHELRFYAEGCESKSLRFSFAEGHKLRHELVTLKVANRSHGASPLDPPATPVPAAPSTSALGVPFWIAGSVGLIGAAGFAYFGVQARNGDNRLGDCAPWCSQSDVDAVRRDYQLANVSLGIGAAGLLTAGIWFLVNRNSATAPNVKTLRFGVSPIAVGPSAELLF